jgi:selenocysteine lyase/cysteine desulfurase
MPGIAGLRAGMEFVKKTTENRILRHEQRILRLLAELVNGEERIKLYRAASPQLQTGVLSFTVQGEDPEVTAEKLSRRGIAVRAGLHCAPLAHDTAGSTGTVRVSFSVFNTEAEVRRLAKVLRDNLP